MKPNLKKILWLGAFIYAIQALEKLPSSSLFFYFKETLHLSESKIQYLGGLIGLAWLIKILFGYLTDNYLTQKKWILISVIGSLSIAVVCSAIPFYLPVLVCLLLVSNLNTAIRDVSVDGLSCIQGKEENCCDKFQKYQWVALTIAGILTSLCGGYIAQHYSYVVGFLALIPFYLFLLWYVFTLPETQGKRDKVGFKETICSYKELFTNKKFLLVCLFLFLFKYSPDFTVQLEFIERDVFGWSRFFMSGIMPAISGLCALLGTWLFGKYYKKVSVDRWLYWSVLVGACTVLGYLYYTPVTSVIYTLVYSVISMFVFLITLTWMAESTISGKEATSYALLASVSNFSGWISGITGGVCYDFFQNFTSKQGALNIMIIVASLCSFLCLPLIPKIFRGEK